MFEKIKNLITRESQIVKNITGSFLVKGASMLLSLFTMPAYMRYFEDDSVLGIWFTMLSFLTWIMMFDFGIGNGLRNKLTISLARNDKKSSKEYITSSYMSITVVALVLSILFIYIQPMINWNMILNVSEQIISRNALAKSVVIIVLGIFLRFILGLCNSIFYALQQSAVNNFLGLFSNIGILLYVLLATVRTSDENLVHMAYANVVISNLPLIVGTIYAFLRPLKGIGPNIRFFSAKKAKEILGIGSVLLWLQIVAMIVFSSHAILITNIFGPAEVVEYNIYYKIFNTISSIFALALIPIWSAVTKAQATKNYRWVNKAYTLLLFFPVLVLCIGFIVLPFLQFAFDIWLGDNSIKAHIGLGVVMTIFSAIFVLHNVNTSVNNGLSFFKAQNIWMSIASVLMIPLSILFCHITGSWIGVIIACCFSVVPYEFIQPVWTKKYLKKLVKINGRDEKQGDRIYQ